MDFKQVENRFKKLKVQFATGGLTEADFKTQLEQLMIQDEQGNWWMLGYETEQWYRHDGKDWIQSKPWANVLQTPTSSPKWVDVLWITLAWTLAAAFHGAITDGVFGGRAGLAISGAFTWEISAVAMVIILRNRQVLLNWKNLFWIPLGWTIGGAAAWATAASSEYLAAAGALGGAIGGIVTVIVLRNERALPSRISMVWIALAWVIGYFVGWDISKTMLWDYMVDWKICWTTSGAISSAIGGFITIWQIRIGNRRK